MNKILINSDDAIVTETTAILMMRFKSEKPIFVNEFFNQVQTVLYDDIGCSGYFRMAPAKRDDVSVGYIEPSNNTKREFMPRENEEIFVLFLLNVTDPDVSISQEIKAFESDISDFVSAAGYSGSQLNIDNTYEKDSREIFKEIYEI